VLYIALLRGVNVGGKNSLNMAELRDCLTEAGFAKVQTYINSGNVLFASEEADRIRLTGVCREAMTRRFGWAADMALLSAPALQQELEQAPPWWGDDPAKKHNAIFVIPPSTTQEIAAQVGEIKPQYEQVHIGKEIIFWSANLATFSRTSWLKLNSLDAYLHVTIRNANTARKLAAMTVQLTIDNG
jgi:uncharacterized protein (DUF1697 family)